MAPNRRLTELEPRRRTAWLPRMASPSVSGPDVGVPVGDTELVGVGVGVGVVVGGDVVRDGSGEIDGCPVVEELPAGAVCGGGLTST